MTTPAERLTREAPTTLRAIAADLERDGRYSMTANVLRVIAADLAPIDVELVDAGPVDGCADRPSGPDDVTPVEREVTMLTGAIEGLHRGLSLLEEQLHPVLRQVELMGGEACARIADVNDASPPLVQELRSLWLQTDAASHRVEALLARLEL